jgi:hypothetical protein
MVRSNRRREQRLKFRFCDDVRPSSSGSLALIQINERTSRVRATLHFHFLKDAAMPLDSILVSLAVVAMFAIFAGALWYADSQA